MMHQRIVLFTGLLVFGLVGFFLAHHSTTLPAPVAFDVSQQPAMGRVDAPVHLVAFEDVKCVNCREFQEHVFPILKKEYIDTGKVLFTVVPLSFLEDSEMVSNAILTVYYHNPNRFFSYLERVEKAFAQENEGWDSEEGLLGYAAEVGGIDLPYLQASLQTRKYLPALRQNLSLAKKLMGQGVAIPSLYINGVAIPSWKWSRVNKYIEMCLDEVDKKS